MVLGASKPQVMASHQTSPEASRASSTSTSASKDTMLDEYLGVTPAISAAWRPRWILKREEEGRAVPFHWRTLAYASGTQCTSILSNIALANIIAPAVAHARILPVRSYCKLSTSSEGGYSSCKGCHHNAVKTEPLLNNKNSPKGERGDWKSGRLSLRLGTR